MSELLYPKVNPKEYLDLAHELLSRDEACASRTAADRAYYAAFLTSRNVLALKGYIEPYTDERGHKHVCDTLKSVLGAFGNEQKRLRDARVEATYNTDDLYLTKPPYRCRRVDWMLNTAREIIKRVEALPDSPKKVS